MLFYIKFFYTLGNLLVVLDIVLLLQLLLTFIEIFIDFDCYKCITTIKQLC
jgi:hypothetical protein